MTLLSSAAEWMNLKDIVFSRVSQAQTQHVTSFSHSHSPASVSHSAGFPGLCDHPQPFSLSGGSLNSDLYDWADGAQTTESSLQ